MLLRVSVVMIRTVGQPPSAIGCYRNEPDNFRDRMHLRLVEHFAPTAFDRSHTEAQRHRDHLVGVAGHHQIHDVPLVRRKTGKAVSDFSAARGSVTQFAIAGQGLFDRAVQFMVDDGLSRNVMAPRLRDWTIVRVPAYPLITTSGTVTRARISRF